jgi:hypothetical protein
MKTLTVRIPEELLDESNGWPRRKTSLSRTKTVRIASL